MENHISCSRVLMDCIKVMIESLALGGQWRRSNAYVSGKGTNEHLSVLAAKLWPNALRE